MRVTRERIRARLSTASTEELHTILASNSGEYTAETYEVALDELARRGEDATATERDAYELEGRGDAPRDSGEDGAAFLPGDGDWSGGPAEVFDSSAEDIVARFLLLPQEKVICAFARSGFVLTTHRVRSYDEAFGRSAVTSIMLNQITSILMTSLSKPWLGIVGVLLLVGSLVAADGASQVWVGGVVLAIALIVAYFFTRREVLSVASAADAIIVDIAGTSEGAVHELIGDIETAQDARFQLLARSQCVGACSGLTPR